MALVRIYQKPTGTPANSSVFAVEIQQNNIWYTKKVSWEDLKGLIAGATSLVFNNGTVTFTTPDGVAHEVLSVDDEVLAASGNPVTGGAVSTALAGKQDTLTFDQVPTDGSTNPVESNGIYDALAGKQDVLTFDTTPTDGSTNPVTSQGIYAAISAITTGIDWKEAVPTYADIATTYPNPQDGWTVTTLDDDHTYRYTGTEWVDLFSLITLATSTKDGLMSSADFTKLSGIEAEANKTIVSDTLTPTTTTKKIATITAGSVAKDINADDTVKVITDLKTPKNATITNGIAQFECIEENLVKGLKVTMNPIQDLHGYDHPWAGGAGKNKLPLTVSEIKSLNTVGEWNGYIYSRNNITFELLVNSANAVVGIKVNGTASANTGFTISRDTSIVQPTTSYNINGAPLGTSSSTCRLQVNINEQTFVINVNGEDNSATTPSSIDKIDCYITVLSGQTANNFVFKPMIRLATETDPTFAPYSNICPISGRTEASITRTAGEDVETHTHQYGQTVYGGVDDFVNGDLSVEWNLLTPTSVSTMGGGSGTNIFFRINIPNSAKGINTALLQDQPISNYFFADNTANHVLGGAFITSQGTSLHITFADQTIDTVEKANTYLTNNPLQVAYKLATPTTIQTSAEEITTVEGTNIISGTEPISECKYTELATVDDLRMIIGGQ